MDRPVTGPKAARVELAMAMLALGATLRETQAATGFALSFLYKLDAHRRRRGPNLTAAEQRNIERLLRRGKMTQRAIARRSKRALGTVNNVARRAELRSGRKRFKRLRRPVRCPKHGLIHLWPCVACEAGARG
jgi:hypothetical protein